MLRLTTCLTAMLALAAPAVAQNFPDRPISLKVGFSEGGPNDILGRLIAGELSERLGQPVEVENLPGESGNIATRAVVEAEPDGYTLLLVGPANAINVSLYGDLGYDFQSDIALIGGITREALVLVVNPSVPAETLEEYLDYARTAPPELKLAAAGNGSSPHVTAVMFNRMAELDTPIEQFKGGGPALKDIIAGGNTTAMFEPMSASITPVRNGELRALAVTTAERTTALPDVPPVADTIPGFAAGAVTGLGAPAGTPPEIIAVLNDALNAALSDPDLRAELAATGGTPLGGSAEEFGATMEGEIANWGEVIKAAGITAD